MPSRFHPQLSHCGVYARDLSRMVDFYTDVVGLVVSAAVLVLLLAVGLVWLPSLP